MRTSVFLLLAIALDCRASDFRQLMHAGQTALAEADIPAAEKLFLEACQDSDENQGTPDMRASCNHHLAIVAEARGDLSGAESRLLKAIPDWELAGPGFLPSRAMSLMNLGEVYREMHRPADAKRYLLLAVNAGREVRQNFPRIYPEALSRLGGTYAQFEELTQARAQLTEAVAVFRTLAPEQNGELARALAALGSIDVTEGKSTSAVAFLSEAVELSISSQGIDHPDTASYQIDLAMAYIQLHNYSRAEPLLKRARWVIESRPVHSNLNLGTVFAGLSSIARAQDNNALAVAYAQRALGVLEASPGRYPAAELLARVNFGASLLAQGRMADAERILADTVDVQRRVAPRSCLLADGLRTLAYLRLRQRSWVEAGDLYREAVEIYEYRLGPDSPALVPVLKEYAAALKRSPGSKDEAKRIEARVRAIGQALPPV
jgi:tetratricopeptide (TPR) repeat protein